METVAYVTRGSQSASIPDEVIFTVPADGIYQFAVTLDSLTPYPSPITGTVTLGVRFTDLVGPRKVFPAATISVAQPVSSAGSVVGEVKAGTDVKFFTTLAWSTTGDPTIPPVYALKIAVLKLNT